jgi:GTPase SAR1 family protein
MEKTPEFIAYKKVCIFGNEGSGKSSLVRTLEKGSFASEQHTENCK